MLDKENFKFVYFIEFMNCNDPEMLSDELDISIEEAKEKLLELEKEKIIKIQYREGKIYGSKLTEKGKVIYDDDRYLDWKVEWGY